MGRKKDEREDFFSMIPAGINTILDVGCADGGWVKKYKKNGLEVVGIECDEKSCTRARDNLSRVFLADVEKFTIPYPEKYFDCIVYADVLEHLLAPWNLLKKHKQYLKDGGYLIASFPNIRYYKAILRLVLGGGWDYMDGGGILDKAHLRFFTLLNIKELFVDAGYKIVEIKRNIIAASGFKFLNFLLFGIFKEFLVYQYYIKAIKQNDDELQIITKRKIAQF